MDSSRSRKALHVGQDRRSFQTSKSRSLVLKRGRVLDRFRYTLAGVTIPSVSEQPVKSVGKVFDSSRKDSNSIKKSRASSALHCMEGATFYNSLDA